MEGYHTIQIPEAGHMLYLPTELAHCNTKQYVEFNELLYNWNAGQISYDDLRIHAIYKLLEIEKSTTKLNSIEEQNKLSNIYALSELIDSFFDISEGKYTIKLNFQHNPMLAIKPMFESHTGPDGYFKNITFGKYLDGLNLYFEYAQHKERHLLNMLLATFYTSKYSPENIEKDAKAFEKYPVGYAYGMFNFFGAFQLFINDTQVSWEGKTIDLSILYKPIGENKFQSDIPGLGMKSLAYQLAETSVFGDYEKVRNTPLWEVILRLYDLRKRDIDNYKQEQELKKKNK